MGFTSIAEERDPEDVRELLTTFYGIGREAVDRHGGRIEKFVGDAIMVLWGAPTTHEDDAVRAVRAGLDIVAQVAALPPMVHGAELRARAGIATGEVIANLGAAGQGMAAGDVVNTAARLQSVAEPDVVLADEGTYRAARSSIRFRSAGAVRLRGRVAAVHGWIAVATRDLERHQTRDDPVDAPFTGRDRELRLLEEDFRRVTRGALRHVVITGEAGIGKSRLLRELEARLGALDTPILWLLGRSASYGEGRPYAALAEMLERLAPIRDPQDPREVAAGVQAMVTRYVPHPIRQRVERSLFALLGIPTAPEGEREQLFAGWRAFLQAVAADAPTVLVFDDLQWADDGLLDFIDDLRRWLKRDPILLLTAARTEPSGRHPRWRTDRRARILELSPLTEGTIGSVVRAVAPGQRSSVVRQVIDRARGVPLYAVELARMLHEGRAATTMPEGVHELLAARLDALAPGPLSLLVDAAVLGDAVPLAALAALSDQPIEQLESALLGLTTTGFLRVDRDTSTIEDGSYHFVHSLLRDVAYARLPRPERRVRHSRSSDYFASRADAESLVLAAEHAYAGHRALPDQPSPALRERAARLLPLAAERALDVHAAAQALAYFEQALEVVPDEERILLRERAGVAAHAAGRHGLAERYLRAVFDEHDRADRPSETLRVGCWLARILNATYRSHDAIELLEPFTAAGAATSPAEGAAAVAELARAYLLEDDDATARAWAAKALASDPEPSVRIDALITLGSAAGAATVERQVRSLRDAARLASAQDMPMAAIRARHNEAAWLLIDDPRRSLGVARRAMNAARTYGVVETLIKLTGLSAADSALETGDWAWASERMAALDEEDLPLPDRLDFDSARLLTAVYRGEADVAQFTELDRFATRAVDGLAACIVGYRWAAAELAVGEVERAGARIAAAITGLSARHHWMGLLRYGWPILGRAAIWSGDDVEAARALAGLDAAPAAGRWLSASRRTIEAGLALRRGVRRAGERAREVTRSWEALDLPLPLGLWLLDIAHVHNGREARRAADRATAIFATLGATALVDLAQRVPKAR